MKIQAILVASLVALGSSSVLAEPLRPIFGGVLPPTEISAFKSVPRLSVKASRPGREPASTMAVKLTRPARRRS